MMESMCSPPRSASRSMMSTWLPSRTGKTSRPRHSVSMAPKTPSSSWTASSKRWCCSWITKTLAYCLNTSTLRTLAKWTMLICRCIEGSTQPLTFTVDKCQWCWWMWALEYCRAKAVFSSWTLLGTSRRWRTWWLATVSLSSMATIGPMSLMTSSTNSHLTALLTAGARPSLTNSTSRRPTTWLSKTTASLCYWVSGGRRTVKGTTRNSWYIWCRS